MSDWKLTSLWKNKTIKKKIKHKEPICIYEDRVSFQLFHTSNPLVFSKNLLVLLRLLGQNNSSFVTHKLPRFADFDRSPNCLDVMNWIIINDTLCWWSALATLVPYTNWEVEALLPLRVLYQHKTFWTSSRNSCEIFWNRWSRTRKMIRELKWDRKWKKWKVLRPRFSNLNKCFLTS